MKLSKIKTVNALLFVSIFMVSSSAFAVTFSSSEKAKLKAGETVVKFLPSSGKKGFFGGSGYAIVDAPVEKVWNLIRDWDKYPKMFPRTKYCKVVSKKGNKTLLKIKIGHPVVSIRYHAQITEDAAKKSLRFDLLTKYPHDIEMLKGYWRLFPQSGGRTLVAYVVSVKAPMGIVAIAGKELAHDAIWALLQIPGDIRAWMKSHP
jgi:ribosome-associated toxin RatA of RatAB toxin-antitoxin module